MVSRIDIGPDGGPYVKINENNNDLELQDINGNVIAKWDETAGHWDFANTSLTNLAAVSTDSLDTERARITEMFDFGATASISPHIHTMESLADWSTVEDSGATVAVDSGFHLATGTGAGERAWAWRDLEAVSNERSEIFASFAIRLTAVDGEFFGGWGDLRGSDSRGQGLGFKDDDFIARTGTVDTTLTTTPSFNEREIWGVHSRPDDGEVDFYRNGDFAATIEHTPSSNTSSRHSQFGFVANEDNGETDVTLGPGTFVKERP